MDRSASSLEIIADLPISSDLMTEPAQATAITGTDSTPGATTETQLRCGGKKDGCRDGWIDGRVEGCVNGWMDG